MASRQGSFLERDVERNLKLAGLKPKLNVIKQGYEIDVFLDMDGYSVLIECKAYERGGLHLINLIHQWESKNREIKANKILFVIIGKDISDREKALAKKHNITIWDENKWEKLKDHIIDLKEKSKDFILREIDKDLTKNKKIKKFKVKITSKQKRINALEEEISEMTESLELLEGLRNATGIICIPLLLGWIGYDLPGIILVFTFIAWIGLWIFVDHRENEIKLKKYNFSEEIYK
jgi:hypothetical protein